MKIKFISVNEVNSIYINSETIKNIPPNIVLNFGTWKKEFKVEFDKNIPQNTICLPDNLTNDFTIPTDIPYEVYLSDNNLYIGPVILL